MARRAPGKTSPMVHTMYQLATLTSAAARRGGRSTSTTTKWVSGWATTRVGCFTLPLVVWIITLRRASHFEEYRLRRAIRSVLWVGLMAAKRHRLIISLLSPQGRSNEILLVLGFRL